MRLIEGFEKSLQTKLPMIDFQMDISQQQGGEGWTGGGPGWDKIPLLTVAGSPRVSA